MKHALWKRAASHSGRHLDEHQLGLLDRFEYWLATEAVEAGGIGPAEQERIARRHIGDSLVFATPLPENPVSVWDLGSGAGLPGIPLAILMPDTRIRLIDRSARRVDLLRRAIRILDLPNVVACQSELRSGSDYPDVLVTRATLSAEKTARLVETRLPATDLVIQGGSWRSRPGHRGWVTLEIPASVLDQTVWLLIMRRQ
ncbi:MAG: RsmG family class I SAM-dependent methyltransferase [Actinomycetota bacterium]|nr:RsmG family class I SAM-dependent methyltransferase [Actinomycetota bacterium]